MANLSEWLQIMLGEIARKRDEQADARSEERSREEEEREAQPAPPQSRRVKG